MIINYLLKPTSLHKKKINDYQVTINSWHLFDESPASIHNNLSDYLMVANNIIAAKDYKQFILHGDKTDCVHWPHYTK